MKAKQRTQAQVREDCLVYDKPVILQKQVPDTGAWTDVQHLHANVNKAVSTQNFSAENERLRTRLLFRLRYFAGLDDVRNNPQDYRIAYGGQHYEITDYDDYNERRRVIKLTGERYELTVTVELLIPTTTTVLGVLKKTYPDSGTEIDCMWETQTGEERKVNGIVSVIERAKITARMRPAITADCRLKREDGTLWEIIGVPENTGLSDRWQVFIVRRISGGA
jgi:head-tail adaptor